MKDRRKSTESIMVLVVFMAILLVAFASWH